MALVREDHRLDAISGPALHRRQPLAQTRRIVRHARHGDQAIDLGLGHGNASGPVARGRSLQGAGHEQDPRRDRSRPDLRLKGRLVVEHGAVVPEEGRAGAGEGAVVARPGHQGAHHGEAAQGVAEQGLVGRIHRRKAGDPRLHLGLDHVEEGVEAACIVRRQAGVGRHAGQGLRGDRRGQVAVARLQDLIEPVQGISDPHDDGGPDLAEHRLRPGHAHRRVEVRVPVQDVDHGEPRPGGGGIRDRDEEAVVAAGDPGPEVLEAGAVDDDDAFRRGRRRGGWTGAGQGQGQGGEDGGPGAHRGHPLRAAKAAIRSRMSGPTPSPR